MRLRCGLALVLVLLWYAPALTQIPVTDGGNLMQNSIQAIQSTITAMHMVMSVANQVLELTPVDEIIVAGQIAEDLALLGDIVIQAQGLSYDIQSLNAQITVLFDLETAPDTRAGLDQRMVEIKRLIFQSRTFAAQTQTLLRTVFRTIEHLTRLIDSISALIGNMQSNQMLIQVHSTVSKTLAVMEAQQASWQRADIVAKLSEAVVLESLNKIEAKRLEDHPRW